MITRDGHAKLLDFGLAKLIEPQPLPGADSSEVGTAVMPRHSTPGTVMGTVGYMSPEQAQGKTKEIDQRSDIFSFGCILFEVVTGKRPFEGESVIKSLHMVIYEPAPPIADLNPSAPPEIQRIVRRCLAKDPDERYQTIKDVAIELKELRREMEASGVDATLSPATRGETTGVLADDVTRIQDFSPSTSTPSSPLTTRASSAEYIVTGLKRHKLAAVVVLLVVAAGSIGLGLFLHARSTEVAIESIAVLPFENRSNDPDADYLSDGLAESLIYRLSQLPNLKVSPTSSVFRYKGREADPITVGRELGVNAVMTGRMLKRGDNLTISAELIDARYNKLLWGEQYERKLTDLLMTQREIVSEITNKLQLKLSGADQAKVTKKYTTDSEAFQLYLKGRFYWNKRDAENLRKAIEQFKAAADKDPNYALAYVGLADCNAVLPFYSGTISNDVLPQAKAYALRALEIDDSLGEAHSSLGYVNLNLWNWAEAEKELKRGIELNPNYATAHKFYGNQLETLGRFDDALSEFKRAQELEPLSLIICLNLAEVYLAKGDLNAAFEQCRRAIDLDPNWYYAHLQLAFVYLKQGQITEARAEAEKSVELTKRDSIPLGVVGHIYAQMGLRNEAAALVEELKRRHVKLEAHGYDIARICLGLGEKDQALAWLEKDFQAHTSTMANWLYLVPLNSLRDDPRFKDLTRRMGMPELR